MSSQRDVEEIRRGLEESRTTEKTGYLRKKTFFASVLGAFLMLALLIVILASMGTITALTVGQVGGFQAEIGKVVGTDMDIYPAITETSACRNTASDSTPEPGDSALGVLKADIGNAYIPSSANVTFFKDIKLPELTNLDVLRVKLTRTETSADINPDSYFDGKPYTPGYTYLWIDRVKFGGIDEPSVADGNDGYQDFTDEATYNLQRGSSYELNVRVRNSPGSYGNDVAAWIDWDGDDYLGDQTRIDVGSCSGDCVVSTNVNVPSTAATGPTLMRVTLNNTQYLSFPDANHTYGEAEDYTVNIESGTRAEYVELGDAAVKVSGLSAETLALRQGRIQENYSDGTDFYPVFGSPMEGTGVGDRGEFLVSGGEAVIENASGTAHYLSFQKLTFAKLKLLLEYNPSNPQVKSNNTCLGIG